MAFDRPITEDIEKLFSRMDSAKKRQVLFLSVSHAGR